MIEGKKIILRTLKEQDLENFFSLCQSISFKTESFFSDLGSEHLFMLAFSKTGFWQKDQGMMLVTNEEQKQLGFIHFNQNLLTESVDLTYCIFSSENRGKGYMTEALRLFSAYLFANKKIHRLQLSILDYQRSSITLAQKCGFTFEGISREALFHKGKYVDLCIYSMLRNECKHIEKLY